MQFTPAVAFAAAVAGVAFGYGLARYRLDPRPVTPEAVVEALDDGIVVIDEEGRIVGLNAVAREILGDASSDGATVGVTAEEAFGAIPELLAAYRDGGGTAVDGDDERRFDVRVSAAENGAEVVVLRNVTNLTERERDLERRTRRLEEFATLLSHDLRGPLSIASGYVDLEREERDTERLQRAADSLVRMDEIIDSLLTLAREGRPVESVEGVDLARLARAGWGHVETGEATLTVETDLTVEADPERLLGAFENLFRNAIEHGAAEEVRFGDLPGGFYVADDGDGFDGDPDDVFEWGYSTGDGTGLGLAIVRRIVDAHGWEVRATDSDEGGARFEVTGVDCRTSTPAAAT